MTPLEAQFGVLKTKHPDATLSALPNGGHLVELKGYELPPGWNRTKVDILFVAPPGYPGARPDCFWVDGAGFRLASGATPQATNDSNPIPGYVGIRSTTWFSWHVQDWHPNNDSLLTYVNVITQRLFPAR